MPLPKDKHCHGKRVVKSMAYDCAEKKPEKVQPPPPEPCIAQVVGYVQLPNNLCQQAPPNMDRCIDEVRENCRDMCNRLEECLTECLHNNVGHMPAKRHH